LIIGAKLLPLKTLGINMKSKSKKVKQISNRFINVELPAKTIDDLRSLKTTMGAKSQSEVIVKMVAVMKAIEKAARAS
jgi:hypothetical protein